MKRKFSDCYIDTFTFGTKENEMQTCLVKSHLDGYPGKERIEVQNITFLEKQYAYAATVINYDTVQGVLNIKELLAPLYFNTDGETDQR